MSISQEVDIEPVPTLPASSWMPEALTVSTYVPSAVVRPESPPISISRSRARDQADRDGARDQVGAAVVGQAEVGGRERAQVDCLGERDVDRADRRIPSGWE